MANGRPESAPVSRVFRRDASCPPASRASKRAPIAQTEDHPRIACQLSWQLPLSVQDRPGRTQLRRSERVQPPPRVCAQVLCVRCVSRWCEDL